VWVKCGFRLDSANMGRPQLSVGTAGTVRTYPEGNGYRATTIYRDYDGRNRRIERHAKTKGAAQRALAEAVRDRERPAEDSALTPATKVATLAEAWWGEIDSSNRSPGTKRLYRDRLDRQIIPSLGNLRIRELTVGAVDRHLRAVTASNGAAVAKAVRSVLSGMCRLACTHDALERNPVRDATPISTKARRKPRSLTVVQVRQLRAMLTYDETAVARDILDFVDMMLATGLRIGETAAIQWSSIDLEQSCIDVGSGIVVRVRGAGLQIRRGDSSKLTVRTLTLPNWAVQMLRKRQRQGPATEELVFPAPKGGLRDPSNTSADLKDAFAAAGFDWMTSHVLRRTVATLIDGAGLSTRIAADQLGHSKLSMTQDRYMNRDLVVTAGAAVLEVLADTPSGSYRK